MMRTLPRFFLGLPNKWSMALGRLRSRCPHWLMEGAFSVCGEDAFFPFSSEGQELHSKFFD